jgi:DNA-binding FrmR family transcriptional regulator
MAKPRASARSAAATQRRAAPESVLEIDPKAASEVTARLARVEGQVRAVARMIDERRDCHTIVQQLSAARTALERATAQLMVSSLAQCIRGSSSNDEADLRRLTDTFIKLL